ncbi:MAG TPA: hypothetical protein VLW50_29370 [Streptosporangiaceae bacterium]|nr:hypothetical protein [Streptosporangiaceae bacterium]
MTKVIRKREDGPALGEDIFDELAESGHRIEGQVGEYLNLGRVQQHVRPDGSPR